jgi:hypothetical protein
MVWHRSKPMTDPAAADVLAAYEAASEARKSTADCYRAGVGLGAGFTWRKRRCTPRNGRWR